MFDSKHGPRSWRKPPSTLGYNAPDTVAYAAVSRVRGAIV